MFEEEWRDSGYTTHDISNSEDDISELDEDYKTQKNITPKNITQPTLPFIVLRDNEPAPAVSDVQNSNIQLTTTVGLLGAPPPSNVVCFSDAMLDNSEPSAKFDISEGRAKCELSSKDVLQPLPYHDRRKNTSRTILQTNQFSENMHKPRNNKRTKTVCIPPQKVLKPVSTKKIHKQFQKRADEILSMPSVIANEELMIRLAQCIKTHRSAIREDCQKNAETSLRALATLTLCVETIDTLCPLACSLPLNHLPKERKHTLRSWVLVLFIVLSPWFWFWYCCS